MKITKMAMIIVADYFKKEMISYLKYKLSTDKRWCLRALQRIFENQTYDQQIQNITKQFNKIGFNSNDAKIMSSIYQFYVQNDYLSMKQLNICYRIMPKYAKQIIQKVPSFNKQKLWKVMDNDKEYQKMINKQEQKEQKQMQQMSMRLF